MEFNEDKFRKTVVEALEIGEGEYRDTLSLGDIASWDSLGHLGLVAAIESAFHVKFETEKILEMSSVAKLKAGLKAK